MQGISLCTLNYLKSLCIAVSTAITIKTNYTKIMKSVFIFKEQTYHGRCLVAYKDHVDDINLLSDNDRNAFMEDVVRVTRAMQKVFNPDKINYGAYADTLEHLHFHLIPKYVGGPDFGGVFQMNPKKVYLTDEEYADMAEALKNAL